MTLLILTLALALLSFLSSAFVILRIIVPILPPNPLSRRVPPVCPRCSKVEPLLTCTPVRVRTAKLPFSDLSRQVAHMAGMLRPFGTCLFRLAGSSR